MGCPLHWLWVSDGYYNAFFETSNSKSWVYNLAIIFLVKLAVPLYSYSCIKWPYYTSWCVIKLICYRNLVQFLFYLMMESCVSWLCSLVRLRLLSPNGANGQSEDYEFSLPSVFARSILTIPWVELGDKVTVQCDRTGYSAGIIFHTKVC
jgi:hypothetical protein